MYMHITETNFKDAFNKMRPNQFSYEALTALFEHLEDLEEDTGQQIELDVIAICCDYTEMSLKEISECYSPEFGEFATLEEAEEALRDETTVIPVANNETLIIQEF